MAAKVDLELLGVVENMSGFTTPDGQRFTIFGEGGGQLLADELDVPLLGKVPLSEELREHADSGSPLVADEPDAPASIAIRQAARGIIAATPQELPVMQSEPAPAAAPAAHVGHRAAGRPELTKPPCRANDRLTRRWKYCALISVYFAHSSGSWSSAKQASTGQASTQASQSMHSSGSM